MENKHRFKKSFFDWCVENNRQDLLNRWDYEINEFSPKEISYGSKDKIYFKCENDIQHKSAYIRPNDISANKIKNVKCIECNSFEKWCIDNNREDLLKRWDYEINKKSPSEITFGVQIYVYFKCDQNKSHSLTRASISSITGLHNDANCLECNSFDNWCKINNRNDLLLRWDYEKNIKLPNQINFGSNKQYFFKCPSNLHPSEKFRISLLTSKYVSYAKCSVCNSFGTWCKENDRQDLLDRWDFDKNNMAPYDVPKSAKYKYYFKCPNNIHESVLKQISHITTKNITFSCIKCNSFGTLYNFIYGEEFVQNYWSDKNLISLYDLDYKSGKKIWLKCKNGIHKDFLRVARDCEESRIGFDCPECVKHTANSKLHNKIIDYIVQTLHLDINTEHSCTLKPINPKTKHILPFDIEIPHIKLLIEVMGIQHYEQSLRFTRDADKSKKAFEYQKLKDRYKKYVANINDYHYLEVPYWYEKDESYKQLIDNKIRAILNSKRYAS